MTRPHAQTDPRGIVTPDAFEVSASLLGLPLARPGKRFVALMIDLAVIGVITLVTKSFALILGVVAAIFFIRMSFKRTEVRGSVFGRAMRFSLGCLGVVIGIVTAIIWSAVGFSGSMDRDVDVPDLTGVPGVSASVQSALRGIGQASALQNAETAEAARSIMEELAVTMMDRGIEPDAVRDALAEMAPEDAAWSDEAETLATGAVRRARAEAGNGEPDDDDESAGSAPPSDVATMGLAEAFDEYARLIREEGGGTDALARMDALRARLRQEVAGDTLETLAERVDDLEDDYERRGREIAALEADQEESEGGFFSALRELVDELGFGFGWASLYLTVTLSGWNGVTVGKKLMGIRVVRLDGEPITWWIAFERAGGYAAGFATGLLGFAQVYWDANRQAIHDRIVGTVVVVDGAEPVGNWEQAL